MRDYAASRAARPHPTRFRVRILVAVCVLAASCSSVAASSSGARAPRAQTDVITSAWTTDQRAIWIYGCVNGDIGANRDLASAEDICACYQAGVETIHPYSWSVDGNPVTPTEKEEIDAIETRCIDLELAQPGSAALL